MRLRPIIGGEWPLEKWHDAFETMHSGAIVKAVLHPAWGKTRMTDDE